VLLMSMAIPDDLPAGASSPVAPATNPACVYTPTDFAEAFLNGLSASGWSAPPSSNNVASILAWEMAEGGNWKNTAKYNPLDTTLPYDGSTDFEPNPPAPVQAYNNWDDGVYATVLTLVDGTQFAGYSEILADLQSSASPSVTTNQIDASAWGTSNASSFVGDSYNPSAPSWDVPCTGLSSVFVQGPGNALVDYWTNGGGTWTNAALTGQGATFSSPAAEVNKDGSATIAVQGPDDSLSVYWETAGGQWQGPLGIGAPGSTNSTPAITVGSTGLPIVAVQGPDDSLWTYWETTAGQWQGPLGVGGPGSTNSSPSITVGSTGLPIVAVQGPGGALWAYWASPTGQWQGPLGLGGPGSTNSSPEAANPSS